MKHKIGKISKLAAVCKAVLPLLSTTAAIVLLLAGCTLTPNDIDIPNPTGSQQEEVVFMLRVPGQAVPTTGTRATDTDEVVEQVDVLLFDAAGDFLKHRTGVITGSMTDNNVKFRVYIEPGQYGLVVVANARDEIDALTATDSFDGLDKASVLELLTATYTPSGTNSAKSGWPIATRKVPMFADAGTKTIAAGMAAQSLALRRMLARIDVASTTADFTLEEIYLVNYNTVGNIAPEWDASGDPVTQTVPAPWLPAGGAGAKTGIDNAVRYIPSAQSYEMQIFTFEAAAATRPTLATAPCLILKGTYGGASYYYRVDFTTGLDAAGKDSTDPAFDRHSVQYMPLLRNYKYTFTVTAAHGRGYTSMAEALASYTMQNNLLIKLLAYDESVIKDIVSDGRNMLGVEHRQLTLDWMGEYATDLVFTDYDYPVGTGWSIVGISDSPIDPAAGGATWLTAVKDSDPSADPKNCHLQLKALMNATVSDANGTITPDPARTAYVHLRAGRLDHVVEVTQQGGAALGSVNVAQELPNCYMITPGGNVTFPVSKAWYVWASPDLAEPIDPALPLTAELVWQDEPGLIQIVELRNADKHSQASIYVKGAAGKQGNAVVAVKSGGEIKWSWHIWVSAEWIRPITVTTNGPVTFMDRNLGARHNRQSLAGGMGLYYQWGRKDPFPDATLIDYNLNVPNSNDYWVNVDGVIEKRNTISFSSTDYSPAVTIANPMTFLKDDSSPYTSWKGMSGFESWSKNGNKTAYDPCPQGWRVPKLAQYGIPTNWAFDSNTSTGWYINNAVFMPYGGTLHIGQEAYGRADHGYYWSSEFPTGSLIPGQTLLVGCRSSITHDLDLNFPNYAGQGFSVRCVKDDSYVAPTPKDEVWARSNVVLKNGKLTFAVTEKDNLEIPANSQGLMFKWGSLIGMNCIGAQYTYLTAADIVFSPAGATKPSIWAGILPDPAATMLDGDAFMATYPGVGYNSSAAMGDVCRYISDQGWVEGRWRMPTESELTALTGQSLNYIGSSATHTAATDTYGMEPIPYGVFYGSSVSANSTNIQVPANTEVFMPYGGYRISDSSSRPSGANGVTQSGYFWSSSVADASNARSLTLSDGVSPAYNASLKSFGFAVRCIRDGDPKKEYYIRTEEERIFASDDGAQTVYMRLFTNAPLAQLAPSFVNTTPGFIRSVTVDQANSRLVIELNDADRGNEVKAIARVSFGEVSAAIDIIGSYHPAPHSGWAGSNIYWDSANNRLTFDDVGVTTHEKYQGLFFKWGSLAGVDTNPHNFGYSTLVFFPEEYKGKKTSLNWGDGTPSNKGDIPYYNSDFVSPNDSRAMLYEITTEKSGETGIGDICVYLSGKPGVPPGKWRMPTQSEFEVSTGNYTKEGTFSGSKLIADTSYGVKALSGGYRKNDGTRGNPFFPASGYKYHTGTGSCDFIGVTGYYWTSSPNGHSNSHNMSHSITLNEGLMENRIHPQGLGVAVRCVRE